MMDCHDELRQQHEDDQKTAAYADELQRDVWCPYEQPTGDPRWPVCCKKDDKYATRRQCDACKVRRYGGTP